MTEDKRNLQGCKRLGIMGGTFDPIHNGHLLAAEDAREALGLSKVVFIPTGNPVFKQDQQVTDGELRFEMVRLAVGDNPHFCVSRMEIDRHGVTYAIDTVEALREVCGPKTELFYITGTDAAQALLKWKEPKKLLALSTFVTIGRPGYEEAALQEENKKILAATGQSLRYLAAPAVDISSSQLRERARSGRSLRYLVPDSVATYIQVHGLYQ